MKHAYLIALILMGCAEQRSAQEESPPLTVRVDVRDVYFEFCNCHHGFGPGMDGLLTLHVTNLTGQPQVLAMERVTFEALDFEYAFSDDFELSSYVQPRWHEIPPADGVHEVYFSPYIDIFRSEDELRPGRYRVVLTWRVGEAQQRLETVIETLDVERITYAP